MASAPVPAEVAVMDELGSQPAENLSDQWLLERFLRFEDGLAFEALVRRHGPMVLGVCRRVLDNTLDAEDAFQATFLVLVRKARSLGKPELLGNWLYGVAYRTARKARAQAARRGLHERQAVSMAAATPVAEREDGQEIRALLDEELEQLPAKYRAPLVLCYLEGLTNEEAARRLGWPAGSMSYRLARGRELLRQRLERRNRALPSAAFALMLAQNTIPAPVPGQLVDVTVQAALASTGTLSLAGGNVSVAVAGLTDETLQSMSLVKRKVPLFVVAAVILAGLACGALAFSYAMGFAPFGNTRAAVSPASPSPGGQNGGGQDGVPSPCH